MKIIQNSMFLKDMIILCKTDLVNNNKIKILKNLFKAQKDKKIAMKD